MNVILIVVAVVLGFAALALLFGRGSLEQYKAENYKAEDMREFAAVIVVVAAVVGVFSFGLSDYVDSESPVIPVLAAVCFAATTAVGILMFYWWRAWDKVIAECKNERALRRQQNKMVP